MHAPGLEVCVSLTLWKKEEGKKRWVYLSEPSANGELVLVHGVWQRWKLAVCCELDLDNSLPLSAAAAALEIDLVDAFFFVFKSADSSKCFSHLGIIVALRVYILMVKGKKKIKIKSYFEDGRPSNQSVFRQCVFKWTFIYKYLFVIASLKKDFRFCIIIYPSCIYIEKKYCTFLVFTCYERKKTALFLLVQCTEVTFSFFSSCTLEKKIVDFSVPIMTLVHKCFGLYREKGTAWYQRPVCA